MPVDMPQIMDEAEKLGKLVAQHPIIERYKSAQKSVAEDAEAKEEKSDKKAPDLSGGGLERKAAWMSKYLMKTEAIKGEKHGRKFRGTEAELATLSAWLETQKTKKK